MRKLPPARSLSRSAPAATLAGTPWEVVGYQARSNPAEGWTWDEYLLFNPYRGFRFLAHDDEGWTLFCMLRQDIPEPSHADGCGSKGRRKARRAPITCSASSIGACASAIPLMSSNTRPGRRAWSRKSPVTRSSGRAASSCRPTWCGRRSSSTRRRARPPRTARGRRPSPCSGPGSPPACCSVCCRRSASARAARRRCSGKPIAISGSDRSHPIASAPFTIPDRSGNLRLDLYAPVQNDWVSLNLSLVGEGGDPSLRRRPDHRILFRHGFRRHLGRKAARMQRVLFRSVPGGSYRLLVDFDAGKLDRSSGLTTRLAASANNAPAPPGPTVAFYGRRRAATCRLRNCSGSGSA